MFFFCVLQLQYLDPSDPRFGQSSTPIRSSLTPTKKVDVDRTIMPDGTIVTTVTTIQTRPKLDRKLGELLPSCCVLFHPNEHTYCKYSHTFIWVLL